MKEKKITDRERWSNGGAATRSSDAQRDPNVFIRYEGKKTEKKRSGAEG